MMDRVSVRADSLEQGRYEASYRTSLPPEESFSQITGIPFAEVRASELQDISAIHHDLQVAFMYTEASSLTSIARGITEHASFDLAHSHPHTKQKIAQGHQVMTVVTTEHPYIVRDARIGGGEPIIVGTAVRVQSHAGIIIASVKNIYRLTDCFARLLNTHTADEIANQIIYV
jgi:hypothetical protein